MLTREILSQGAQEVAPVLQMQHRPQGKLKIEEGEEQVENIENLAMSR